MRLVVFAGAMLFWAAAAAGQAVVLCESPNNAYRECRVGSGGVIRLVFERSDRRCYEGTTWGTRSGGIVWVDRGCSATFQSDANDRSVVVCESQNGKMQVCKAVTDKGVTLRRQLSRAACLEQENWGYEPERNEIWVDDGCRAEFALGRLNEPAPVAAALDGLVTCESAAGRRKECVADTSAGVQLVQQLGDAACTFNQGWGFNEKGIWVSKGCRAEFAVRGRPKPQVKAVVCESAGERVTCPAETQFGIALVKQLGAEACILGDSWGFDQEGIWVANRCRGQFVLGGYRLPETAVPATASRVRCESADGKREVCAVDTGRGVGLVRQLSETTCVLNRTWGYGRDGIWVAAGCRAEFAIAR